MRGEGKGEIPVQIWHRGAVWVAGERKDRRRRRDGDGARARARAEDGEKELPEKSPRARVLCASRGVTGRS